MTRRIVEELHDDWPRRTRPHPIPQLGSQQIWRKVSLKNLDGQSLKELMLDLQALTEVLDDARIDIDTDSWTPVSVLGWATLTEAEIAEHEARLAAEQEKTRKDELAQLAALKAKYPEES